MHIDFTLRSNENMEIPITYNHIVQAAIYSAIDPELATFLHEIGYSSGNRIFKLFTFSRLSGRFQVNKVRNTIIFLEGIKLTISSPVGKFCQSIANGILTNGGIQLGQNTAELEKMMVKEFNVERERVVLRTLSPVVVYSTLLRPDGRKYTCYYQPGEPDYDISVENNLRKKYMALYGIEAPYGEVKVKKLGQIRLHVMKYKDTVIKGYSGKLVLTGPKELLQMGVDAGIGSKNSQGFGCVEVVGGR